MVNNGVQVPKSILLYGMTLKFELNTIALQSLARLPVEKIK
jgi:hypothetical protein